MAAGGLDEQSEGGGCDSIESWTNNAWEACHGLQTFKVTEADVIHTNEKELDENFQAQIKKVMTEEIVHFYQQQVLGKLYPDQFGNSWSSSVCKEVTRLQCMEPGWHHPENDSCDNYEERPAPTPIGGYCSAPDCDCVEFFQQAALMNIGQQTAWLGDGMPNNRVDM
jgi:hypothetical protein